MISFSFFFHHVGLSMIEKNINTPPSLPKKRWSNLNNNSSKLTECFQWNKCRVRLPSNCKLSPKN